MTTIGQPRDRRPNAVPARTPSGTWRWLIPLLIAVVVFAAFLPVLRAGFVNWDDDHNIINNPHLRSLGPAQLRWMFTQPFAGHYQPLTWLSLAVDYQVWGLDRPGGFHLTNLVLHVFTAVAVYLLATRLITLEPVSAALRSPRVVRIAAAVAALLFALHPLRVESVAWVTERRDVLSGLFFVLSILAYLNAARLFRDGHPHSAWYAGSIVLCALSLLCKAHAVTLVGVLVLLDIYPLRRFAHHRVRPLVGKAPFLVLSAVFAYLAIRAQARVGALYPLDDYDFTARVAQALYGHAFYLSKLVFPIALGPLYDLPERAVLVGRLLWVGLAVLVAVGVIAVLLRRRFPFFALGWGWYVIVLLPVSGLLQSGAQLAADRYTYVSCIGWAVAGGALFERLMSRSQASAVRTILVTAVTGVVLAVFGVLTWQQSCIWHDSQTLWQRGTRVSPNSAIAHTNLGDALMRSAEPDCAAAMRSYQRALKLNPRDAKAHNGVATAALPMNRPDVALLHLEKAVLLDPQYAFAHLNLGYVLAGYGRLDEAIEQYRWALKIDPAFSEAAFRLADMLVDRGRYAQALETLRSAASRLPEEPYIHSRLSWLLATCPDDTLRDGAEALAHGTVACRLAAAPDPSALDCRAAALAELHRFDEAAATARRALDLARTQDLADLATGIEQRIALYQAKKPYRLGM